MHTFILANTYSKKVESWVIFLAQHLGVCFSGTFWCKNAFRIQSPYTFIDCSIENGIVVAYWRSEE